jgi:dolichol kinase
VGSDGAAGGPHAAITQEAARKAIHLTSAAVPLGLALGVARIIIVVALAALFALALIVEIGRRSSVATASRFMRLFAPLLREHETHSVTGATWLLGAMLAAVAILPRDAAIAASWAVAVGDASAALIGIRFGRHRARESGKSLEGSAACAITTALGALLLAHLSLTESSMLGVVAALAERATWPADDNARIVMLVGASAWLWSVALY